MSKEEFKNFVRKNPQLVNYVRNNEVTWQEFYEMYDLYGEENDIWTKYLNNQKDENNSANNVSFITKDIFNLFKGTSLKTIQKTLNTIEKAIDTLSQFNENQENKQQENYEERPVNRYYED